MSAGRRVYFPNSRLHIRENNNAAASCADKRRFNLRRGDVRESAAIELERLLRMSGNINHTTERLRPLSLRSRPSIGRKCRGGRAACLMEGSRQYRNWSRKYSHYTRVAFFVSTVPGHVRLPPARHPRSAAWICGWWRSV